MGETMNRLKNWINQKMATTTMGYAAMEIKSLYSRNIFAFSMEMLGSFVFSILISGTLVLCLMNLAGNGYAFSLYNIFAAWVQSGIFVSVFVFLGLQVVVSKFIRLFTVKFERDTERNMDVSTEGVYGTANLMSREEMESTFVMDTLRNNKSILFGKDPENPNIVVGQKHPLLKINRNVLMIAGPNAGKSATFIMPLILQIIRRGESACINDPKGELFKFSSELGKKLGYEVRILNLNPMFLENSDPCNFLKYVGNDIDKAQVVSKAIIENTTAIFDFWAEGAENLLQFLMLYINCGNIFRESQKNLPMVFRWLIDHNLEEIDDIIYDLPEEHPAKAPGMIFSGGEPRVKAQTLQGLRIKLKLFNSPKLRKILSKTKGGLDILNPGRKKCLYFIGSNDQDSSMDPIVSLFFTLLYQELVRYADMRADQELPIAVHMVLDELVTITIPSFEKKLSTVRSRNIITYMALQDINQLKTKFPMEAWRTVVNDCDYFMLLKTNDTETMDWWNTMCGEMTINIKNARYSRSKLNISGYHMDETITEGLGTRDVMTKHEVRTLKEDEVLLLVSQRNPVKLKTFYWKKDHPYANHITEVLPTQHYPLWRLLEDGIVTEDFDYDHEPSIIMEIEKDEELIIDENYDPDKILNAFKSITKRSIGKNGVMDKIAGTRSLLHRNKQNLAKQPAQKKEEEPEKKEQIPTPKVVKRPVSNDNDNRAEIQSAKGKNVEKPVLQEPVKRQDERRKTSKKPSDKPKSKPKPAVENKFFNDFGEDNGIVDENQKKSNFELFANTVEKKKEKNNKDEWEEYSDVSSFWEEF